MLGFLFVGTSYQVELLFHPATLTHTVGVDSKFVKGLDFASGSTTRPRATGTGGTTAFCCNPLFYYTSTFGVGSPKARRLRDCLNGISKSDLGLRKAGEKIGSELLGEGL